MHTNFLQLCRFTCAEQKACLKILTKSDYLYYAYKMNQYCVQSYNLNNPPISTVFHMVFTKPTDGTGCLIVPNFPDVQVKTPIFMAEP